MIYDRITKEYTKTHQLNAGSLHFLYDTKIGRIILKILICPFISHIVGFIHDTKLSKIKIKSFIKKNNIDMTLYEDKEYNSFNEFFKREKKDKRVKSKKGDFLSPADSKLLVYKITDDLKVTIKNTTYKLNDLVDNKYDLNDFNNGYCLIFRLALDDYHRYCYPDDGKLVDTQNIKGKLHTVSSFSKDYEIYKINQRTISKLKTDNFDDIIFIEVGALSVGRIINHNQDIFEIGEEKGYFEMGSTIVVLTKDNVLKLDEDILNNATKEIEVKLKYGEKIGNKI